MIYKTKIHTVIFLIGENSKNKNTFLKDVLVKQISSKTNNKTKIVYINENNDEKLESYIKYPINIEHVVIDVKDNTISNINEKIKFCLKYNYNIDLIIFDNDKRLLNIKEENISTILKLNKHDMLNKNIKVDITDKIEYENRFLDENYDWIPIGDVHGCYEELKLLIKSFGIEINEKDKIEWGDTNLAILSLGDLVDKSSLEDIKKTIDFVYKNMGERFKMIIGNHEETVYKWISGTHEKKNDKKALKKKELFYNTTLLLENDEESKKKFLKIFEFSKGWLKLKNNDINNNSFVFTHAPCEVKYLEKMDSLSFKKQVKSTSRSANKGLTNDQLTPYLIPESNIKDPIHIFGHMGQSEARKYKNKICIDSGCVYGGKLIGIKLSSMEFKEVKNSSNKEFKNSFSSPLFDV